MGTTNDENKDFTDFFLRLCAKFFSPAETLGRGGGLGLHYFPVAGRNATVNKACHRYNYLNLTLIFYLNIKYHREHRDHRVKLLLTSSISVSSVLSVVKKSPFSYKTGEKPFY